MINKLNRNFRDYYLENTITDENGCMIWQGSSSQGAYGRSDYAKAELGPDQFYVHRYIALSFIEDEEERIRLWQTAVVMHKCDVKLCINPDHLKIGTNSENRRDAIDKELVNFSRGEGHYNAKVTEDMVRAIRDEYDGQVYVSQYTLARKYGLKQPTISAIVLRKIWAHVK